MKVMKVLFVYPNNFLTTCTPLGLAYMSAVLKKNGVEVDIFDATFYNTGEAQNIKKEKLGQAGLNDYSFFDDIIKDDASLDGDYLNKIEEFKPDLIGFSVVEEAWGLAHRLLKVSRGLNIPTVMGGVFATFAPKEIYSHLVDGICLGEGEGWILKAVTPKIHDFTKEVLTDGALSDLNKLPMPDYDLFHPKSLYRPMQGKIRKTVMIETQRGCPYNCNYCNSKGKKKCMGRNSTEEKQLRE